MILQILIVFATLSMVIGLLSALDSRRILAHLEDYFNLAVRVLENIP